MRTDLPEKDMFADQPCEVCGNFPDKCTCQECPICGIAGDPECSKKHGLINKPQNKNMSTSTPPLSAPPTSALPTSNNFEECLNQAIAYLIMEQITRGTLTQSELLPVEEFPMIKKGLAFPAVKRINPANIYATLIRILERNNGKCNFTATQGAYYPQKRKVTDLRTAMPDIGYNAEVIELLDSLEDEGLPRSIADIVSASRHRHVGGLDPLQWKTALEMHFERGDILSDMPFIFRNYQGAENKKARMILLVSGEYAEGLYILPSTLNIEGQNVPWDQAVEMFTENPNQYVESPPETIVHRIRLLFRKWMQNTDQGKYLERKILKPTDVVQLFGASGSLEEFVKNFTTKIENILRNSVWCENIWYD